MTENSPSKTRQSTVYHSYRNKNSPTKPSASTTSRPALGLTNMKQGNFLSFSGGSSSLFPSSTSNRPAMSEVSNLIKKNLINNPQQDSATAKQDDIQKNDNVKVGVIGGHRPAKKPPSQGFIPIENSFQIVGVEEKESMGRKTSFTLTSKHQGEGEKRKNTQPLQWPIYKNKRGAFTGKSFFPPKTSNFSIYEDENRDPEIPQTEANNSNSLSQNENMDINDSLDLSFDRRHSSYRVPLHDVSFRSDISIVSDSGVSVMSEAIPEDEENSNGEKENLNSSINLKLSLARKDLARMSVPSPILFADEELVVDEEVTKEPEKEKPISIAAPTAPAPTKRISSPALAILPPNIARMLVPKVPIAPPVSKPKDFSIPRGILSERKHPLFDFPEYSLDILNYWLDYEKRSRPRRNYMSKQQEISYRMRTILVDWIVEVGMEYEMHGETIFLAVSCVDRFLSKMNVARGKLQLIGTAALFVSSKYEEIRPPDINDFVYITDETYNKQQVLQMEVIMLNILSFDLTAPTAYDFVRSYASILRLDSQTTCLSVYLTELTLMDGERYLHYLPSIIATAAISLSRFTFQGTFWDEKISVLTCHSLRDVQRCAMHLFNSFYEAPTAAQTAIYDKYKAVRYCSISQIILPATLPWIQSGTKC